jgi:hypothetical protein
MGSIVLSLMLGCIGPQIGVLNMKILSAKMEQCEVDVTATRKLSASLTIQYRFFNRSPRNAYLFNVIPLWWDKGICHVDRNRAYITVDNGRITISKKIIPVPPLVKPEKRIIPFVTRVGAGQTFEETLLIGLPLTPWAPYQEPQKAGLSDSAEIFFELGFFVAPSEGDKLARTVQTTVGPLLLFDPFPESSQKILRVGPLPVSVPVGRRGSRGTTEDTDLLHHL